MDCKHELALSFSTTINFLFFFFNFCTKFHFDLYEVTWNSDLFDSYYTIKET